MVQHQNQINPNTCTAIILPWIHTKSVVSRRFSENSNASIFQNGGWEIILFDLIGVGILHWQGRKVRKAGLANGEDFDFCFLLKNNAIKWYIINRIINLFRVILKLCHSKQINYPLFSILWDSSTSQQTTSFWKYAEHRRPHISIRLKQFNVQVVFRIKYSPQNHIRSQVSSIIKHS